MYKYVIFALLYFGIQNTLCAQNKVFIKINSRSNQPFPKVNLEINTNRKIITSDTVLFENLSSGDYHFVVSAKNHQSIDTLISIENDIKINFDLIALIDEVVIESNQLRSDATSVRSTISQRKINENSHQNLGDILKEISGISTLKTGSSIVKPVINGLHSSRILILNQNVRMEDQQWGLEHAPNLDINSGETIKVYKGAQSLQFGGDAIGGVIILENKTTFAVDSIFGKTIFTAQSNGKGATLTSNLNRNYQSGWHWNIQGTLKYLGDFNSPDYILSNTGNREKNFSTSLGFQNENYKISAFLSLYDAEIGILKSSHIGNITDLANAINSGSPSVVNDFTYNIDSPKQNVKHYLGKINFYKYFTDSDKLQLQYSFQLNDRKEYDIRRNSENSKPSLDLNLITNGFQADYEKTISDNINVKFGTQFNIQNNKANTNTGVRPLIPDYDKHDLGIYGISTFKISNKTILESGLRYDYSKIDAIKFYLKSRWNERRYDQDFEQFIIGDFVNQWKTNPVFEYQNISASIGVKHTISKKYNIYLNWGFTNRNPNPSELFSDGLHHSTGQIELGDLRLKKETSNRFTTTFVYNSDHFLLEVSPFLNQMENYIFLQPTGIQQNIRGVFPVWEYQQTTARLIGFDADFNWKINKNWNYKSGFAYVKGKDLNKNNSLIDMPSKNWKNAIMFELEKWNQLKIELKNEIVFTQKEFPNNDFMVEIPKDGAIVPTLIKISQPPKGYQLWDFSTRLNVYSNQNIEAELGFMIQNLFNTTYRDYLNRNRFYTDEIGRNFLLQLKINY